jgi:hypothetical protein
MLHGLYDCRSLVLSVLSVVGALALAAAAVLCPAIVGAAAVSCAIAGCAVGLPGIYNTIRAAQNIRTLNKASQACTDHTAAVQAGQQSACDVAGALEEWKNKVDVLKIELQGVVTGVSTITDGVRDAKKVFGLCCVFLHI